MTFIFNVYKALALVMTSYMTLIFNVYKALALVMPMSKELLCNILLLTTIDPFLLIYTHTHTEKHPIDTFIFEANYLLITCEATYTVNQVETTRVLSNRVGNVFGSGSHETTLRKGGGGVMVALLSSLNPTHNSYVFNLLPKIYI